MNETTQPQQPIHVLLVEDNPADARLLVESLKEAADGFHVTHVARLSAAIEQLRRADAATDVVALDLSLPDSTGLATVQRLQTAAPGVPIVVLTGLQDERLGLEAVRQGVQDYLVKGYQGDQTARALRYAVERRRVERALHASEQRYRAFTTAASDVIYRMSPDWAEMRHLTGRGFIADTSAPSRDWLQQYIHPDDRATVQEAIQRAIRSKRIFELEHRVIRADGTLGWTHSRAIPITDASGQIVEWFGAASDVTQRRAAEEALRAAEEQLRTITDAAPALIGYVDRDGIYRLNNQAYESWFGQRRDQMTGRHIRDVLGPAAWAKVQPRLDRAMAGEEVHYEDALPYAGDEPRWVNVSYTPDRDADGNVRGVVILVTDISEIRAVERASRENEARLSAVFTSAVDAIITIDERGVIDTVNPATEHIFGYAAAELVGHNVRMLMPEPYNSEHDGYLRRYLQTGKARIIGVGREVVGLRKDGTTFPLSLSVSEFTLGTRRMFTGMIHDISNRRRLEQEILEASANEQRRIGHELHDGICQQILGASFGMEVLAQRLEEDGHSRKQVPAVRKLMTLLNDTLTQTRALSHGLNPIDLRAGGLGKALSELARRISETFQVRCRVRETRHGLLADASTSTHLYRIAQEAISNAIKHGRAKRIEIELSGTADGWLYLTITDDGKGIPATLPPTAGRGLQIMQYRAALIGASVAIRAGRTGGTVVSCSLRLSSEPSEPAASPAGSPVSKKPSAPKRSRSSGPRSGRGKS